MPSDTSSTERGSGFVGLRDVAADVPALRAGVLLLSAAPHHGDPDPVGVAWPPDLVVDLRGPAEYADPHPLQAICEVRRIDLIPTSAADQSERPLVALRRSDVGRRMVEVVREIARGDGATLVHDAEGDERTGLAIAFVLRLCGIGREQVATLDGVLDQWDAHPGGVNQWFRDHGGDDETLDLLRRRLLRSERPTSEHWLDAAVAVLASDGPTGLTADRVAAHLEVSAVSAPEWVRDDAILAAAVLELWMRRSERMAATADEEPAVRAMNLSASRPAMVRARSWLSEERILEWGPLEEIARGAAERLDAVWSTVRASARSAVFDDTSGLFLYFPEFEDLLGPYRARLDRSTAEWGLPCHITVFYPFLPIAELTPGVRDRIRAALDGMGSVPVVFDRFHWPDERIFLLNPSDPGPFAELTARLSAAFPGFQLYAGAITLDHHITVAADLTDDPDAPALLREAEKELAPHLPLATTVSEVLLVAGSHRPGSWKVVERFAL